MWCPGCSASILLGLVSCADKEMKSGCPACGKEQWARKNAHNITPPNKDSQQNLCYLQLQKIIR